MRCEGFPLEDYSFYVLGGLEASESEQIRAHLGRGCEFCGAEVRRNRALWDAVALGTPAARPSRALRSRILQSVNPRASWFSLHLWWVAASAGLVVAAAAAGWMLSPARVPVIETQRVIVPAPPNPSALRRLEDENQTLRSEIARALTETRPAPAPPAPRATSPAPDTELAALRARVAEATREVETERTRTAKLEADLALERSAQRTAQRAVAAPPQAEDSSEARRQLALLTTRTQELERQLAEYKALLASANRRVETNLQLVSVLNDPGLVLVRLRGTEAGRAVEGHALLTAGSQVIFYGSHLPVLPAGRIYQLWLIRAQSPAVVSAGVFNPDAGNRAALRFASASFTRDVTAIAVTEEPAGGSEKPTGHKILIGQAVSPA